MTVCSWKDRVWWFQLFSETVTHNSYTKAISQQRKWQRMPSTTCACQRLIQTLWTTQEDARSVSRGALSTKEPLQPHDIPDGLWRKLGMDFFDFKGKSYILVCDYFSKFSYMYTCKSSWCSLKDCLIDLFAMEGYPKEIVSDNGSPFNSHDFALFLSSHSIKQTTSSLHYPQSSSFIERQIQTVKNLMYKALDADTQSFQNVLAELRATKIGNGLQWLLGNLCCAWPLYLFYIRQAPLNVPERVVHYPVLYSYPLHL